MLEVPVYNTDGKKIDTLKVDEKAFGSEVNVMLLKQAVVTYHANSRQGTAATKGRSEVAGSTRKLFKQKGTGNARRGNIRTNVMRGGGVAFAKLERNLRRDMPRKMLGAIGERDRNGADPGERQLSVPISVALARHHQQRRDDVLLRSRRVALPVPDWVRRCLHDLFDVRI